VSFRPRFIREAVLIPYKNGFLVDGTTALQRFRGTAAERILPQLLILMDGSRNLEQLESALPHIPPEHIRELISALSDTGLIEDGSCSSKIDIGGMLQIETRDFFSRFLSVTKANRSAGQVFDRLRASEVLILAKRQQLRHLELLASLLSDTGVHNVRVIGAASFDAQLSLGCRSSDQPLAVALSLGGEDRNWYRECDDYFRDYQSGWLRIVVDAQNNCADIGPHFRRSRTPCYECFQRVQSFPKRATNDSIQVPSDATIAFWVSFIALEIVYSISRLGPLLTQRGFRRYDLKTWESKALCFPYISGCERCSLEALTHKDKRFRHTLSPALVFEDYVGAPYRLPGELTNGQAVPNSNVALINETKCLPTSQQVPLSEQLCELKGQALDRLSGSPQNLVTEFTADQLGTILRMTAGIRKCVGNEGFLRRWAATAGNLGSVELYVVVRSVDGIQPGLYFYQPRQHSLARLEFRHKSIDPVELIKRFAPTDPLSDAIVIYTGAYHRLKRNYGPFGYRLMNMDAGVAIAQSHCLAKGLQVWSQTATNWSKDAVETELFLDTPNEQATGIVLLSHKPCNAQQQTGNSNNYLPVGRRQHARKPKDYYERTTSAVLDMLNEEVHSNYSDTRSERLPIPFELLGDNCEGLPIRLLSNIAVGGKSIDVALRNRRSILDYATDPVSIAQIGTILCHGYSDSDWIWPDESLKNHILKCYLLALRVEGLSSGLYLYDPGKHALCRSATRLCAEVVNELFVQSKFASAPAHIWIVGNLALSSYRYGAWGHRRLLLHSGCIANRFWIAALSLGLSGCIVAGLVSGAARQYLGFDGRRRAAVLSFTFGYGINGTSK
jgi:SagB-type dehydrogenase family enzyme